MSNDDLNNLRAVVRKRRAAVSNKIYRIRISTGVDVAGHPDDPRRPPAVIKKYNKAQLSTYLRDLNSFMARDNQYVAGAGNVALPRKLYKAYKNLEDRFNLIGDKKFEEMADIFLPTHGMSIRQREAMLTPSVPKAGGENTTHPYTHMDKKAKNIASVDALKKLIADMNRRLKGGYNASMIKLQREEMRNALDRVGMHELKARGDKLSNQQFDMLWNYAKFGNKIYDLYHVMKMMSTRSSDARWYDSVVEDSSNELGELFDWAESISPENVDESAKTNTQNRSSSRGKKNRK